MQPGSFLPNRALRLELPHRTVERRWIHAHRAAHLADRHSGLGGHPLEHLLAALPRLRKHAAGRVIAHLEAKALGKLAQLAVLLDQWLQLFDAYREISLEPAEVAQDRRCALLGFSVRS